MIPKYNKTINLKSIIQNCKVLNNVRAPEYGEELPGDGFPSRYDPTDIDSQGGGGGFGGGGGGGTGGGTGGTTSSNIGSGLTLSPSGSQSIVTGTTICLNASGVFALPQEAEQSAILNGGCSAMNSASLGTWVKNCGTNGNYDSQAYDTNLIYSKRPFQFTGRNSSNDDPGGSFNNVHLLLGVKSTSGYLFFWEVYKYCNANSSSNCESRWISTVKIAYPNGVYQTLLTGYVEFNQMFRLRSDGNTLFWDYTTEGKWVYGRMYMTIPSDVGDFQLITDALWMQNKWRNLVIYKGSYQATLQPEDFTWTTDCFDDVVVTGNKACYTPLTPGSCKICVSTVNSDPKCATIVSSPLTLTAVGKNCLNCGDITDSNCVNIPNPTIPDVTLSSPSAGKLQINWADSISFTAGLYYEIDINDDIQRALDSDVTINSLPAGPYTVSVRAIDSCGESEWSTPQTVNVS